MANTFRKIYKKTGNNGNDSDYELVGNVGVDGVELDIMKGSTSSADGEIGLVPKPTAGQQNYILGGDGTFKTIKSILSSDGLIKNDLTTTSSGYLLDAYQGKVLNSKLSELNGNNAGAHNAIYRGKSLGTSVTAAQYSAISAGTFEDMYIGDYWTINDVVYRIAAFDYYLRCGDTECIKHHVVLVPDTCLYNHVMNDTNTTTGAYVNSKMYTEGLSQAKTTIKAAFSGHVLSKRIYLSNATSNGRASAGEWTDSTVDLMCEHMVYGSGIFSQVSDGSSVPNNYRVEKGQLPLFQHEPSRICNRSIWWLRDVITAAGFADVYDSGGANYNHASYSFGVRPAFCIG